MKSSDPGIGDALAPVGSEEWAKRWRLEMQAAMKNATNDQERVCRLWKFGIDEHRAWTKLNRSDGKPFKCWREFASETVPWGLGSKWETVEAILVARNGRRATQRETVPEPRTKWDESTPHDGELSINAQQRLRAINRAPEIVGRLYDEGLISQVDAAKLGKKELDASEVAAEIARVVEETKDVESVKERRKAIKEVAKRVGGGKSETTLDKLKKLWGKATEQERRQFLKHANRGV